MNATTAKSASEKISKKKQRLQNLQGRLQNRNGN